MNKKILSLLQYAFFLGLGIFLVWWSLGTIHKDQWPLIKDALRNANYWLLIPVVVALLASHLSRAIRWRILMEPLGYKPRVSNTFMAVLIGYMANLAVPRLGEVLKCTALARYEKIPADKLVGTIVAERAFDLICLTGLMIIIIVTQTDLIGTFLYDTIRTLFGSKASHASPAKLITLAVIVLVILGAAWYVLRKYAHLSFIKKISEIIRGIWQGLTSVRYVKRKGWFIFHTIFIWSMYLASVRIGMLAMSQTAGFGIQASMSVLFTGSIAMIITPSGIGAYPELVLRTMDLYGLNEAFGKAFGWLLWTVQFFQILVCGLVALVLLPYLNKRKHEEAG